MKLRFLFVFIFYAADLLAMPKKLEVIFLSRNQKTSLLRYFDESHYPLMLGQLVEWDTSECVPMGDGCFHPQHGFIEEKPTPLKKEKSNFLRKEIDDEKRKALDEELNQEELKLKTFNSMDIDMVDCKEGPYFDIFCGKATHRPRPEKVELWVDTSASMRDVDYSKDLEFCDRRKMITKVLDQCALSATVSVFNTSRMMIGSRHQVCQSLGLNDGKRAVDWIKGSNAEFLLLVTDVEEYVGEFREFLDSVGAKIHGIGINPLYSDYLIKYSDEIIKNCK